MTALLIIAALIGLPVYAGLLSRHPLAQHVELAISLALFLVLLVLARSPRAIRYTFILCSIAQLRYLIWRLCCTVYHVTELDRVVAYAMVGADIFSTVLFLSVTFLHWHRRPDDALEAPVVEIPQQSPQPSVDVFITTVIEPVEILRRTIAGAVAIDYDNKDIFVLDDGAREEVRQLAGKLKVNYISRVDRSNYKAGNLNNALQQTDGEFILQLDADDVPASSILKEAMPELIKDEKLFMVQFAHRAINAGVCERTLRYRGFSTYMGSTYYNYFISLATWGMSPWSGSGAVLRRSALEKIGGVSTECVIEDFATTFQCFSRGMKSLYIPNPRILAMTPETLSAHLVQQKRWFTGAMQLYLKKNFFSLPGLTRPQRLMQYTTFVHFWTFLPRFVWMLSPVMFFCFHAVPVRMQAVDFVMLWGPVFYLSLHANFLIMRKNSSIVLMDVLDVARVPAMLSCLTKLFFQGLTQPFQTTPKGIRRLRISDRLGVLPYAILLLLVGGGVVRWTYMHIEHPDVSVVMLLFTWYYAFILACLVFVSFEKPEPVFMNTVPIDLPVSIQFQSNNCQGRLIRVSECGGTVELHAPLDAKADQELLVTLSDQASSVQKKARLVLQKSDRQDRHIIEVSFHPQADEDLSAYTEFVRIAICRNKSWQKRPDFHCQSALPNLVATPLRKTYFALRKLAAYKESVISDRASRFFSTSIRTE